MSYKSSKSYTEAYLRSADRVADPTGLNPLTLVYAAHLQSLERIAEALEAQLVVARETLVAIQGTKAELDKTDFSVGEHDGKKGK